MLLDLDSPESKALLKASAIEDRILSLAKRMTLVPTGDREKLLGECKLELLKLEDINQKRFAGKKKISDAISSYEVGLVKLASHKASQNLTQGIGVCEVCETEITNLPKYPDMIYCQCCLNAIREARSVLESSEGFGFCYI